MIEVERHNGCPPCWRDSCNDRAVPAEMICPNIPAGVIEGSMRSGVWIGYMRAVRLVEIAGGTSQRQVCLIRLAATGAGRNVLQMECGSLK